MRSLRILIVEDERIVAKTLKAGLERYGHEIVGIASSGEAAIKIAEEFKPDLMLVDIVLDGDMDGIEAASIIRSRFGIPLIITTAYSEKGFRELASKTEPLAYLVKPFSVKHLIAIINEEFSIEE